MYGATRCLRVGACPARERFFFRRATQKLQISQPHHHYHSKLLVKQ